jgi:TRAP transporter TAXI family solute receptor
MRRRSRRLAAGLLAGMLVLAACGGERKSAEANRLSIATGNTTGVYYVLGGGLAKLINTHLAGYRATAEVTSASVENIQRVAGGGSQIAFTLADAATDAVRGVGPFGTPQPIRALARIYSNYTHVIVRTDAGVSSLADLRGRTVSTGSPGSGTEVIALRLLRAAGLDPDRDVRRQRLALPETTQGVADGTIQALVWSGGLPTAGIKDLFASAKGKVRFLDISPYLSRMRSQYTPLYAAGTIARSVYGTGADVPTIAVPTLLVVRDTMSSDLAYKLTKLLFDYRSELAAVHKEASNINLTTAQQTGDVLLHDGAKRYYAEQR